MEDIRFAAVSEVAAILAFWASAAEDAHRPADTEDAVLLLITRDSSALVLAWSDDELVGSLIGGWDGWRFHLYRLAVAPHLRGQGIARRLLATVEARFKLSGATRIDAMVLADNDLAHSFWSAAGYSEQVEWRRWVKPIVESP